TTGAGQLGTGGGVAASAGAVYGAGLHDVGAGCGGAALTVAGGLSRAEGTVQYQLGDYCHRRADGPAVVEPSGRRAGAVAREGSTARWWAPASRSPMRWRTGLPMKAPMALT